VAPGAWPVVAVAVVLLGLLGALVAAAGPAQLGAPRLAGIAGVDLPGPVAGVEGAPPQAEPELQERRGLPGWVLVAAWTLGLCAVALLVLRSLRRAGSPVGPTENEAPAGGDSGGGPLSHLGELRDVSLAAVHDLRNQPVGQVADLVVLSWERLEEAAARAGSARPPHATPTEFTAGLLATHGAPPDATAVLLDLYHRARFSSAPLPPGAGPEAVAAFDEVAASLRPAHDDALERRGPR